MDSLKDVTAVLLVGGRGTRLRPVIPDQPKALAEVRGRPFIAHLLDQIAAAGARQVVLCTGYLGEQVWGAFGDRYDGLRLSYSQEPSPQGTAGALRLALELLESDCVLVMNGDSYCEANLNDFWAWHRKRRAAASLLLAETREADRYGRVLVDADGRVLSFEEKKGHRGPGCINAGVYLLTRPFVETIPPRGKVSLESEIFPASIGRGLYGYLSRARFLDIGTPEAYSQAAQFFAP